MYTWTVLIKWKWKAKSVYVNVDNDKMNFSMHLVVLDFRPDYDDGSNL